MTIAEGIMDLNKLEYFVAISQTGSLSAAAEKLFLSRQSLSQALKAMESELGAQLFERRKTGLVLTEEGKCLLEGATRILADWKAALDSLDAVRAARQKRIRAGFGRWTFNLWPIDQAERFHALHPDISLDVTSILPDLLWKNLCEGTLDVMVTCVFPRNDESICSFLLCRKPLVCMMGSNHPLAALDVITPEDLNGHTVYEYSGSTFYNNDLRSFLAAQNVSVRYEPFPSTEISTLFLTAKENKGVWPCSAFYATLNFDPARVVFRPFLCPENSGAPSKDVYAIVKKENARDPALQSYIRFLRETVLED